MKTSNFRNYTGEKGVSICLYPPLDWVGLHFSNLAPDKETFFKKKSGSISEEAYTQNYKERVLSKLDPNEVYEMFKDRVLLCWEDPVFDEKDQIVNKGRGFCHRHLVSDWIFENVGVKVDEWNPGDEVSSENNVPLF